MDGYLDPYAQTLGFFKTRGVSIPDAYSRFRPHSLWAARRAQQFGQSKNPHSLMVLRKITGRSQERRGLVNRNMFGQIGIRSVLATLVVLAAIPVFAEEPAAEEIDFTVGQMQAGGYVFDKGSR